MLLALHNHAPLNLLPHPIFKIAPNLHISTHTIPSFSPAAFHGEHSQSLKAYKSPIRSYLAVLLHVCCCVFAACLLLLALLAVKVHYRSSLLSMSPSHQAVSELMSLHGEIARCCSPDLKITLWYDPDWIDCMLLRPDWIDWQMECCCSRISVLLRWLLSFVGWITSQAVRCSEMNHVLMVILTSLMVYETSLEDLWCS